MPSRGPSLEQIHVDAAHSEDIVRETLQGMQAGQLAETCPDGTNGVYFLKNEKGERVSVFKPIDEEGQRPPNSPILARRSPRPAPRMATNMKIAELKSTSERSHASSSPKPTRMRPTIQCVDQIQSVVNASKSKKTPQLNEHGIPAGESALREVAASLIDQDHFYGVPKTTIVKIQHWESLQLKRFLLKFPRVVDPEGITKLGSLQEYVENDGSAEEISPSLFPVSECHKIGILDLHLMNTDRNDGNILARKVKSNNGTSYELVPIDHSFCVPNFRHIDGTYFAWLTWPQSKVPFSETSLQHIDKIDPEHDIMILKNQLGLGQEFLISVKIGTLLLKTGAKQGLTLYDIGSLASRDLENADTPSPLENLIASALDNAGKPSLQDPLGDDGSTNINNNNNESKELDASGVQSFDDKLFFSNLQGLMDEAIAQYKKTKSTAVRS